MMRLFRLVASPAIFAALATVSGGLVGCHPSPSAPVEADAGPVGLRTVRFDADALARLGVKVGAAGEASGRPRLVSPGTLEYTMDRYAEIGVMMEGRIASVAVRVGDRVRKGQVLATVQVPSLANAQAEYLGARAAAQETKQNADREETLLAKELTTTREAQVARAEATKAQAALAASEARLEVLGVEVPESQTAIKAAGVLPLTSPLDGVVVQRKAVLGAFVTPQETILVVADPRELWATVDVFESDLAYFQTGAPVELTVDALPGRKVTGTVALMEPHVGSANRSLRARIAVPNADGTLRPGLFVRAAIDLPAGVTNGRVAVPAAAVQPLGDDDVVFVERSPGVFEVRPVRVDRRTSQVAEIAAGLSSGERIAVEGAFLLRGEVTKQ